LQLRKACIYRRGCGQVKFKNISRNVNTAVLQKELLKVIDANTLIENGEYLDLRKEWAQRLMTRISLVKQKGALPPKLPVNILIGFLTNPKNHCRSICPSVR